MMRGVRTIGSAYVRVNVRMSVLKVPATSTVTPSPNGATLVGQRLGPSLERGLGRRVCADARACPESRLARHHDDAASAGGAHRRQQLLGQADRSEEVRREDLLPDAHRQLFEAADASDTRVVHQAVGRSDGVADHVAAHVRSTSGSSRSRRTPMRRGSSGVASGRGRAAARAHRRANASPRRPSSRRGRGAQQ